MQSCVVSSLFRRVDICIPLMVGMHGMFAGGPVFASVNFDRRRWGGSRSLLGRGFVWRSDFRRLKSCKIQIIHVPHCVQFLVPMLGFVYFCSLLSLCGVAGLPVTVCVFFLDYHGV